MEDSHLGLQVLRILILFGKIHFKNSGSNCRGLVARRPSPVALAVKMTTSFRSTESGWQQNVPLQPQAAPKASNKPSYSREYFADIPAKEDKKTAFVIGDRSDRGVRKPFGAYSRLFFIY